MAAAYALRNIARMAGNNLRALRKRAGLKQPAIAEAMGVSVPQVSRWEASVDNIPSHRLASLASAYRATIGEIFDGPLPTVPLGPPLHIKGEVAGGMWKDAFELPEDEWQTFYGRPDVTVPLDARFGLRVVGESMNAIYPHGTILECVKVMQGAEIASGKRVIVVRQREDFEYEATVKEFVVDDDGVPWLWPRSYHPEFQTPWRMDQDQPGIRSVTIVGVVVASTRYE